MDKVTTEEHQMAQLLCEIVNTLAHMVSILKPYKSEGKMHVK